MNMPYCKICHRRTACWHYEEGAQRAREIAPNVKRQLATERVERTISKALSVDHRTGKPLSNNPSAIKFRAFYAKHRDEYNKRRRERKRLARAVAATRPYYLSGIGMVRPPAPDPTWAVQFATAMAAGFKQGFAAEIKIA
jgi:hypothetical protein